MSTKIFIDTLFIIALINQRDIHHSKASELALLYDKQAFVTTNAVLLEVGNALARKFKTEAVEIINEFLASSDVEIIWVDEPLFEQAYSIYKQYTDKDWGLIDCISFAVMQNTGIDRALTFDQHFSQAGFQALMRD